MCEFNAQTTTDDALEGVSLAGQVIVVTGASAGLGVETARALSEAGASVVLLARDRAKLKGAATSVWAATAPELVGRGGLYLEDCQVADAAQAGSLGGYQPHALDPVQADRLWELSEQLVGQKIA